MRSVNDTESTVEGWDDLAPAGAPGVGEEEAGLAAPGGALGGSELKGETASGLDGAGLASSAAKR